MKSKGTKIGMRFLMTAVWLALSLAGAWLASKAAIQDLTISSNFADKASIAPGEVIELRLSRPLQPGEGRLAVFVGQTDMTSLFTTTEQIMRYGSAAIGWPLGETEVAVYLVTAQDDWREIARLPLRVAADATPLQPASSAGISQGQAEARRRFGFDKLEFAPAINIGLKSQLGELHSPDANRPERPRFTDATMQGGFKTELARGSFQLKSRYDLVGSSFRNEGLRFAALGDRAPKIDLANYLTEVQLGKVRFASGHSTFGAHRHLVNNFASRGLTLIVPLGGRADFSISAMNSTNIVGWDNFFGLSNRRHQLLGGVFGLEIFKQRPGGLRLEAGIVDARLQPRPNFNQGSINDAERSRGLSARVTAQDKSGRARLDAGFTRSQFINPEDPLLNPTIGGASVIPSRQVTRNGRYAEASFDLFKDFAFSKTASANQGGADFAIEPKKLNLAFNLRHERVDPLFRSIGASTQADIDRNQFEVVGSYGETVLTAAHARFNDNLAGIQTILRTNTRTDSFAINTPLHGFFGNRAVAQPNALLPRIGYTFERIRAFAGFIPRGGGFDSPGAIPDQANVVQSFIAEWQFKEMRLGYRANHSSQDNRASGRERADLQNFTHNVSFGWNPQATLDLNLDLNFEGAKNRELTRSDRTLRFGFNANWQTTTRQSINATFSTIGARGLNENLRSSDSRNVEFDLQWNYRLTRESESRFKKFQTVYFIRYSNRFARARNAGEGVDSLSKLQTFNTGLNFIFF